MKATEQIFLSFARFPDHDGVMKIFNRGESKQFPVEYAALKLATENLAEKSLVPQIKDFVFGVTEDIVTKVIQNFTGFYLLVDYGQMEVSRDGFEIQDQSFFVSITVAHPMTGSDPDIVEETIVADLALDYLTTIRAHLITQDRDRRLQEVTFPHDLIPFQAPTANNSVGWTIVLTRNYPALI